MYTIYRYRIVIIAASRRPTQKRGALKHATTITSEDPSTNRDLFITNPNQE
jgi:hypothetical protein